MTGRASAGTITIVNPANFHEVVGRHRWSLDAADDTMSRARHACPEWAGLSVDRRAAMLRRFRRVLKRRGAEIAAHITRETGKAIRESREEATLLITKIEVTIEEGIREVSRRPAGPDAYCEFRPYGVAVVLGPFNFPLHLAHGHIVPALLAGNTVVFKPSDKACGAGDLYARCAREAGFPAGVVNVVQGPASVGECLALHPAASLVLFTGSYRVGLRLKELTLRQPDKVLALEMGGKNAAAICADAAISQAAAECARSAYATAGQRCTSTSRIFVERPVLDEFCDQFAVAAAKLRVGDPMDEETFCGPLISDAAVRRAESAIREARRIGGTPILHGGRLKAAPGYFAGLSAHRFPRYPGRHRYTEEELFIPEAGIYPVDSLDEAIERVESVEYSLACSIFTKSRARFESALSRTTHGILNWNIGTIGASGRLPFGGRKRSGNARPAALFAIRNCVFPVAVRRK